VKRREEDEKEGGKNETVVFMGGIAFDRVTVFFCFLFSFSFFLSVFFVGTIPWKQRRSLGYLITGRQPRDVLCSRERKQRKGKDWQEEGKRAPDLTGTATPTVVFETSLFFRRLKKKNKHNNMCFDPFPLGALPDKWDRLHLIGVFLAS